MQSRNFRLLETLEYVLFLYRCHNGYYDLRSKPKIELGAGGCRVWGHAPGARMPCVGTCSWCTENTVDSLTVGTKVTVVL
jgi:hypothetical protein